MSAPTRSAWSTGCAPGWQPRAATPTLPPSPRRCGPSRAGWRRTSTCSPHCAPCARSSPAPVRSTSCCAIRAPPTSSSAARRRCGSTAGRGLERTGVRFADDAAVRRLAQRLAVAAGRGSTTPAPTSTAGSPTSGSGCTRCCRRSPWTAPACRCACCGPRAHDLAALRALGTVDALGEALLRAVLAARLAFLVSGGTGTGKTTMLSALLGAVGRGERIVTRRGRRRAATAAPARRPPGGAPGQHRGRGRGRRCATWSGRRCGCGPTGWSSARSAAPRCASCSPR